MFGYVVIELQLHPTKHPTKQFHSRVNQRFGPSLIRDLSMLPLNHVFIDLVPENNCFSSNQCLWPYSVKFQARTLICPEHFGLFTPSSSLIGIWVGSWGRHFCSALCEKMKFGKELASQMVQEWGEAYMDYNFLKGVLKDISRFRRWNTAVAQSSVPAAAATRKNSLKRRLSMYRAFSGLTNRLGSPRGTPRSNHEDEEVILVNAVEQEGVIGAPQYQTMFPMSSEAGGEYELVFFRRLDDEFNKVVRF